MANWLLILLASAALGNPEPVVEPSAEPTPVPRPERCAETAALVSGPPAPELFDPHGPGAGRATWCEEYDPLGNSRRVGPYSDRYPSGAPRTRARFVAGRLEGPVEIRHETGGVWLRAHYRGGLLDGPHVIFHPNGRVWERSRYEAGQREGVHSRHHIDGALQSERHFRGGQEHGTTRVWWPNGALRREREVVEGVWSGPYSTWYASGQLESRGHYAPCPPDAASTSCERLGAARHGVGERWHENGQRAARGQYRYGEKVGTWVYWDEDGQPELVNVHREGDLVRSIRTGSDPAPAAVSSAPEDGAPWETRSWDAGASRPLAEAAAIPTPPEGHALPAVRLGPTTPE